MQLVPGLLFESEGECQGGSPPSPLLSLSSPCSPQVFSIQIDPPPLLPFPPILPHSYAHGPQTFAPPPPGHPQAPPQTSPPPSLITGGWSGSCRCASPGRRLPV
jgi:hypothetical protein